MGEVLYLRDLVIILATSLGVVILMNKIKVPSIAAFILAGMMIGPNGLRLIEEINQVEIMADIGVVLLIFGKGVH